MESLDFNAHRWMFLTYIITISEKVDQGTIGMNTSCKVDPTWKDAVIIMSTYWYRHKIMNMSYYHMLSTINTLSNDI